MDEPATISFLEHPEATCSRCGYLVHGLREPTCPECQLALTQRNVTIGRRIRTRGAAVALVVCCALAMLATSLTMSDWRQSLPREWLGTVWAVVLLAVAGVLVWPAFTWIRKRQAAWREMRVPVRMPWLAFAPWVLLAMGVNVAMWLPRVIAFVGWWIISLVQGPIGGWVGYVLRLGRVYEVAIVAASIACYIGLATAETRGRLSMWMKRSLVVLIATPCAAFVLYVWGTLQEEVAR
jgi:hypothetical protein